MDKVYFLVCLMVAANAIRVELTKTYLQLDFRPGGPLEIEDDILDSKSALTTVDTH
jgi:hypothetical protein